MSVDAIDSLEPWHSAAHGPFMHKIQQTCRPAPPKLTWIDCRSVCSAAPGFACPCILRVPMQECDSHCAATCMLLSTGLRC